jgi:predicted kinase
MNVKPLLILLVGLPGTGKTTLAKQLAVDLEIPVIGKDEIKKILFDTLGWKDREWSVRLGGASFDLLYLLIEKMLSAGSSFMLMPILATLSDQRSDWRRSSNVTRAMSIRSN